MVSTVCNGDSLLNIFCAQHNAYILYVRTYIYVEKKKKEGRKGERERERGGRDASEVLRRNSVIIRGGRDRPEENYIQMRRKSIPR